MRSPLAAAWIAAFALLGTSCVVVDGGPQGPPGRPAARAPGPPPHAPAHGYRHKHRGHDLAFDSRLGVYVVVGLPDLWFFDGSYFRWVGDRWEIGVDVSGPWRATRIEAVPVKLRAERHPHGGPPGQMKKKGKR